MGRSKKKLKIQKKVKGEECSKDEDLKKRERKFKAKNVFKEGNGNKKNIKFTMNSSLKRVKKKVMKSENKILKYD